MTAGEFAFLALGLVLGVASGAALIEVLRARPPAAHEVRLTVSPNAIRSRMAATLADPHGLTDQSGPASGGPGDRRWRDEIVATGRPAATDRRADERGAERAAAASSLIVPGTPVRHSVAPAGARLIAVPMSMEPDPITAALRSTAAASAAAATARASSEARPEAMRASPTSTSTAVASADIDRPRPARDAGPASMPAAAGADGGTSAGSGGGFVGESVGDSVGAEETSAGEALQTAGAAEAGAAAASKTVAAGPCAEERRVADERCSVATRARDGAAAAAENLRRAQRSYDELVGRAEAAAALADPRAVRAAKEQAQQRFRDARENARTRDDVEAGARAWLAEINRINQATREASLGIERDRAAALTLGASLERLAVEADAARISAARADEACLSAREAVAACDEASALDAAAVRAGAAPPEPDGDAGGDAAAPSAPGPGGSGIAPATPDPEDEFAFSSPMHSQAAEDATIIRILRGDREAMQRAVARLAGDDPEARRLWQAQLGGLVEALIARSIEATAFDFPLDHPFWGPFSQSQNRDIAAGLSSLGFRFDGFGSWVDDHQPSQRDLSLAVGYAGLDPMRVRRWPTEAETSQLLSDVRVAADEYVAGAAGGLTLGEMVTMLGLRADGLAELWNHWGSVRPILLEAG